MRYNAMSFYDRSGHTNRVTPKVLLISALTLTFNFATGCGKGSSEDEATQPTTVVTTEAQQKEIFTRTLFKDFQETKADGSAKYKCVGCHSENDANSVQKNFASPKIDVAYKAINDNKLVNLSEPSQSPLLLVIKPGSNHFCSINDCENDYPNLLSAIKDWAKEVNAINNTVVTASAIESKPTTLALSEKANVATKRVTDGLIALYLFRDSTGTATTVQNEVDNGTDLTNLNLTLTTNAATAKLDTNKIKWIIDPESKAPTQGIQNISGAAKISTPEGNKRIFDAIVGTTDAPGSYAYTAEAWVTPDQGRQNATLINYSQNNTTYNFSLGRANNEWRYRNNSEPSVTAMTTTGSTLKPTLQHIVVTFDNIHGRQLYINGANTELTEAQPTDGTPPPTSYDISSTWVNDTFAFVIGNETNSSNAWKGKIYLVALYKRALTLEEVNKNFTVGYTDPTVLRFNIQDIADVPNGQIEIEATSLDDYSYTFARPFFLGDAPTSGLRIEGIQIKVNDSVSVVGQGFRNVSAFVTSSNTQLSSIGTTIPVDKGKDNDVFTLVFETMGRSTNPPSPTVPGDLPVRNDNRTVIPDSGVRTFDQINDTMSELTGVAKSTNNVASMFKLLRQQLPSSPNMMSFLPAQQVGIAKLASEYCDTMINNTTLRDRFFGTLRTFKISDPASTAFATVENRNFIIDALFTKMMGTGLSNQPTLEETRAPLSTMIDALLTQTPPPTTANIVKGACTTVLSSAAVMIH